MIELHVHCLDGKPCVFDGQRVEMQLEIFNAGQTPVSLPAAYYRRQGPVASLIDNKSGLETSLGVGRPQPALMHTLETLAPGQSLRFRWAVMPDQILDFALQPVDVTARFGYSLQPERGAKAEFIWAQVPIVAK